jgi:hypothetical protein
MYRFLQHFKSTPDTLISHVHLISCFSFFYYLNFSLRKYGIDIPRSSLGGVKSYS